MTERNGKVINVQIDDKFNEAIEKETIGLIFSSMYYGNIFDLNWMI
jgi:hypothetical protein